MDIQFKRDISDLQVHNEDNNEYITDILNNIISYIQSVKQKNEQQRCNDSNQQMCDAAKPFTDLEQSIKLQKILSISSADMFYFLNPTPVGNIYMPGNFIFNNRKPEYDKGDIPCWSLAALFAVLPETLHDYHKMLYYYDGAYHCNYLDDDGVSFNEYKTTAANPVDACYSMVLNLHENMLLANEIRKLE